MDFSQQMKTMSSIFLIITLLNASPIFSSISLGELEYRGTGCPDGSVSVVLSPDKTGLSILFDSYYAQAGGDTQTVVDKKTCKIRIPINVSRGKSVAVFQVDYRGFNMIPTGASAELSIEYYFSGRIGHPFNQRWSRQQIDNYLIRHTVAKRDRKWSQCGRMTDLKIDSAATAKTNQSREEVYTAVDTIDLQAGLTYYIDIKDC